MKKLLVFIALLGTGVALAHHFGYLQRVLPAGLAPRLIPKDSAMLAYFRPDAQELLLLNATEADFLVSDETRREYEQDWKDFEAKTGIDVREDVDAVALADGLGVARGRFDWARLSSYLQSEGYTLTELAGVPAAVKSHAADVALDGKYLLLGRRSELERALARKHGGQGLEDGSALVEAIDEIGWKHTLVGGLVSGSRLAPHAPLDLERRTVVGALDSTSNGFEVSAVALTASKEEGETVHAALELVRKALVLKTTLSAEPEARALRNALEDATLEVDPQGRVRGFIRLPHELADQASANVSQAQLPTAFQSLALADNGEEPATVTPPAATPPQTDKAPPAPPKSVAAPGRLDWKPPVFGLIILVLALVTMGAKGRPGLFNVLLHPLFLLPFLVSTLGVFVFRWTGHAGGAFDVLSLPLPEWHRFLSFDLAQPIALSAAIPIVFALLSGPVPWLRHFAAGLAVGFSGYLAARALAGTDLAVIPPAYTLYWYAANAVGAALLARLTLPSRLGKAAAPSRPAP